jgi:hypothetical protein
MYAKTVNKVPLDAIAAINSSITSVEPKIELKYV